MSLSVQKLLGGKASLRELKWVAPRVTWDVFANSHTVKFMRVGDVVHVDKFFHMDLTYVYSLVCNDTYGLKFMMQLFNDLGIISEGHCHAVVNLYDRKRKTGTTAYEQNHD